MEGDVLRRMARRSRRSAAPRIRARDSSPPIAAPACRPSSRRRPLNSESMPRWSSSIACARTMSRTVMTGKLEAPGLPVFGLVEAGPGGAHAAADHVRADHEIAFGVDRPAGPDHGLPPARLARDRMQVGDVLIAGERVADQHRIAALGVERAVGLIGDLERREIDAGIEPQRLVEPEAHDRANCGWSASRARSAGSSVALSRFRPFTLRASKAASPADDAAWSTSVGPTA